MLAGLDMLVPYFYVIIISGSIEGEHDDNLYKVQKHIQEYE